jgi:transcriptional regulator with XRE-family HTH domain
MTSEPPVVSKKSPSKLDQLMASDASALARGNSVRFQVALHLMYLRRFREWSQARLAGEMKTSQSAVARIEGGEENVSADTVERAINALNGRLTLSISPSEMHFPRLRPWWEMAEGGVISTTPFVDKGMVSRRDSDDSHRVLNAWISGENTLTNTAINALLGDVTNGKTQAAE